MARYEWLQNRGRHGSVRETNAVGKRCTNAVAIKTPVPKCLERKRKRRGTRRPGNRRARTGNEHAGREATVNTISLRSGRSKGCSTYRMCLARESGIVPLHAKEYCRHLARQNRMLAHLPIPWALHFGGGFQLLRENRESRRGRREHASDLQTVSMVESIPLGRGRFAHLEKPRSLPATSGYSPCLIRGFNRAERPATSPDQDSQ